MFSHESVIRAIVNELNSCSSKASASREFNSNRKGFNKKIEQNIDKTLSSLDKVPLSERIDLLVSCNFREEWLLKTILPRAAVLPGTIIPEIRRLEGILVRSCLKLAVRLAVAFKGKVGLKDAIQQANLELVDAARKFDPTRNTRFVTYAHQKVRWRLQKDQWDDPKDIIRML